MTKYSIKILASLAWVFLLVLVACSDDVLEPAINQYGYIEDEETITLSFGLDFGEGNSESASRADETASTYPDENSTFAEEYDYFVTQGNSYNYKTFGEEEADNASVYILAFDENHILTNVYTCTNNGTEQGVHHKHHKFTVTLNKTNDKRYFHVIVNHNDLAKKISQIPLATEADIFTSSLMKVTDRDTYWRRIELDGVQNETVSQLNGLKVIRNFARIELKFNLADDSKYGIDNFKDVKWGIVNNPTESFVAPYLKGQEFATYISIVDNTTSSDNTTSDDDTSSDDTSSGEGTTSDGDTLSGEDTSSSEVTRDATLGGGVTTDDTTVSSTVTEGHDSGTTTPYTYNQLYAEGYRCHVPRTSTDFYSNKTADEIAARTDFWHEWYEPQYVYENEGSSESSSFLRTSLLIKVTTNDDNVSYYRLNLTDPARNYEQMYIMRNVAFDLSIVAMNAEGFSTVAEALSKVAANNISGESNTQDFTNISANNASLRVEYMKKYIFSYDTVSMKVRYVPDITVMDTDGSYIANNNNIVLRSATGDSDIELGTDNNKYVFEKYEIESSDWLNTNYRKIIFHPNKPQLDANIETSCKVKVLSKDNDVLYRIVEFILHRRYEMIDMDIVTDEDSNGDGKSNSDGDEANNFILTVKVPSSLPQQIFPVEFTIESDPLCFYPNPIRSVMQVEGSDESLFEGGAKDTFHYHRAVTWTDFNENKDKYGNIRFELADDDKYKKITFFFKVNTENLTDGQEIRFAVWNNCFSEHPNTPYLSPFTNTEATGRTRSWPLVKTFIYNIDSDGIITFTPSTTTSDTTSDATSTRSHRRLRR